MSNELPLILLEKLFNNTDNSIIINNVLEFLIHINHHKNYLKNNLLYQYISMIIKEFPHYNYDQWIEYIIIFFKNHLLQSNNFIIEFNSHKPENHIIFQHYSLFITYETNIIKFIYYKPSLIKGSQCWYKNHVIDNCLIYRWKNLENNILKSIV